MQSYIDQDLKKRDNKLNQLLQSIDDQEGLAAILANDHSTEKTMLDRVINQPKLLKAILSLMDDKTRLLAIQECLLIPAAKYPDTIRAMLELYSEQERLAVIQLGIQGPLHQGTLLHIVANMHTKSLITILSLLSKNDRIVAVNIRDFAGHAVLHNAAANLESIKAILDLYPEQEKHVACEVKNSSDQTPLFYAVNYPECLNAMLLLYPEQKRLSAVLDKDDKGYNLLHEAALYPESLARILMLLPEKDRLTALLAPNNYSRTPLHEAEDLNHGRGLIVMLSFLSEQDQLTAVQQAKDREGKSILENFELLDTALFYNLEDNDARKNILSICCDAILFIKPFLLETDKQSRNGILNQNEMVEKTRKLLMSLNKLSNKNEIKLAITNFLSINKDENPSKIQKDMLDRYLNIFEIKKNGSYQQQLDSLIQNWNSKNDCNLVLNKK